MMVIIQKFVLTTMSKIVGIDNDLDALDRMYLRFKIEKLIFIQYIKIFKSSQE